MRYLSAALLACFLSLVSLSSVRAFAITNNMAGPEKIRDQALERVQTDLKAAQKLNKIATTIPEITPPLQVLETKKHELADKVCQAVTSRVDNRINQYENNQDKWSSRHQGVVKRLTDLADKLAVRGCDVSSIRADISTYQELLTKFQASFRLFIDTLKDSRTLTCGQGDGEFAGKISQARTQLLEVRQNALALTDFFKNSLRPHLSQTGQACKVKARISPKVTPLPTQGT